MVTALSLLRERENLKRGLESFTKPARGFKSLVITQEKCLFWVASSPFPRCLWWESAPETIQIVCTFLNEFFSFSFRTVGFFEWIWKSRFTVQEGFSNIETRSQCFFSLSIFPPLVWGPCQDEKQNLNAGVERFPLSPSSAVCLKRDTNGRKDSFFLLPWVSVEIAAVSHLLSRCCHCAGVMCCGREGSSEV